MAPVSSNTDVLRKQQETIDARCAAHPSFSYAVSTLSRVALNKTVFVPPHGTHVSIFSQYSPVGASRIVADAASIAEHIERAITDVRSAPRRDPADMIDADLLGSIHMLSQGRYIMYLWRATHAESNGSYRLGTLISCMPSAHNNNNNNFAITIGLSSLDIRPRTIEL